MEKDALVYLLCGSNLTNRIEQLDIAYSHISEKAGNIISSSSYYETDAWGIHDQPAFINQALGILTDFSPHELLICLKEIEKRWEEYLMANGKRE